MTKIYFTSFVFNYVIRTCDYHLQSNPFIIRWPLQYYMYIHHTHFKLCHHPSGIIMETELGFLLLGFIDGLKLLLLLKDFHLSDSLRVCVFNFRLTVFPAFIPTHTFQLSLVRK